MIATASVIQDTKAAAADKSLISPRFYVTDYKKMNALRFDHMADAFKAMHKRFADDPNKHFFKRDDDPDFDQDFSHLPKSFKDFLIRGCIGEFSGALLYKEIADRIEDPILSDTYRLMARDEGRHSGFIRLALRDIGADLDLQLLQNEKEFVSMHPKIILYTTYLSEVIGYFRYINIYSHLEAHPEYRYHPVFKYFGGWCQDELKHGDFIGLQLEAQKHLYLNGGFNRLLIRFFSLAVYVTMWLRDLKAQDFYASIGLDWRAYDLKVIRETNAYAQRVFGLRLDVDNPKFIRILDRMAERYTRMMEREAAGAGKLALAPMQAAMAADYLRLLAMKVRTDAPPPIPDYPVAPVVKGFAVKQKSGLVTA
ncbi:MAG: magnesium-protoporphyrin IX monomethyl ester (oxidative) cyclase [Chloracidobacterium sp.]|nr:magnesium-protoporphyrin IX monomethyl ester (oxidative) cyclase [Chloracidobacterium sp.]MDW8218382.1 magnesium-protoporphyrin IX monomethyl ester (oxidative) cyclase [Acidobacteriota bacterium]